VFPHLDRHIGNAQGRVILTTFASSTHRVSMILELAMKHEVVVNVPTAQDAWLRYFLSALEWVVLAQH
jgi:mRNA degradation ribonuclease J1/J2